jgi:hypothetical protein
MPKWLEFDEFYLTAFLSSEATSAASAASRRVMAGRPFQDPLRAAVRRVPEQFPSLRRTRLTINR